MQKKQITIDNLTWILIIEDTGCVVIKKLQSGELSRTQFKAFNMSAALQYIWASYNQPDMKSISEEDLTEWGG